MNENLQVFLEITGMKHGAVSSMLDLMGMLMLSDYQGYTLSVSESNDSLCMTLSLRQSTTPEMAKPLASFIEKTIANGS